jgi:DNA-binding NarL/FixJ family response regulator
VTKVVIADGQPLFRVGLASVLEKEGHDIVGQAGSVSEAVAMIDALQPDVVVVDKRLGGGGFAVLTHIKQQAEAPLVIFNADSMTAQEIESARSSNAICIIEKSNDPQAYLDCLNDILAGNSCCRAGAVSVPSGSSDISFLSSREIEVAQLVGQAKRNDEIAAQLDITVGTVKVHLSRIFKKLKMNSRVELSLYMQSHLL